MELWIAGARESARLYGDLLQASFVMMREAQAAALQFQVTWPAVLRDPFGWYQKTIEESVERTQKALRTLGGGAEAVSESVQRFQGSTEKAGRAIQEGFSEAATKVKEAGSQAA
jgi:hypothetical protein